MGAGLRRVVGVVLAMAVAGGVAWGDSATEREIAALTEKLKGGKELEKANWYLDRAQKYIKIDKYAEALSDCDTALALAKKLKATLGPVYAIQGRAKMFSGDYPGAIEDFRAGLKSGGDKWVCTWGMGYTHYLDKAFGLAVEEFGEAVKIEPKNGQGWHWLAETKFMMGDYAGAMAAGRKAHEADGEAYDPPAYDEELARLNGKVWETGKGIEMRARAAYLLGKARDPLGFSAALVAYDEIIKKHEEEAGDFVMRARLRMRVAASIGIPITLEEKKMVEEDLLDAWRDDEKNAEYLYVGGRLKVLENEFPATWAGRGPSGKVVNVPLAERKKRAAEAVEDLEKAAELLPEVGEVHFWAARAQRMMDKPDAEKVLAHYERAIEKEFSRVQPVIRGEGMTDEEMKTEAYLYSGKIQGMKQNWVEVVNSMDGLLEVNSESLEGLRMRAEGYVHLEQFAEALEDLRVAAAIEPGHAGTLFMRGVCRDKMGDYRGAQADLRAAVGKDETLKARLKGSRYENLEAVLPAMQVPALKVDPEALKLKVKGNELLGTKEYKRAAEAYTAAIAIDGEYADALNNRAVAETELGEMGAALVDVDRAIAINPWDRRYFLNRSSIYEKLGKKYRELADAEAAVECMRLLPEKEWSSGHLIRLGICEQGLRRFEKARDHLAEAHAMEPLEGWTAMTLGLCYAMTWKEKEAVELTRAGMKTATKEEVALMRGIVKKEREGVQRTMDAGVMVVTQLQAVMAMQRVLEGK
jgi:tetratricopeptide (TPR) repeat protein